MKVLELVSVLETYFPKSLQEGWDNSGLQVSPEDDSIDGILLCLDVGLESISEARTKKCNLIISHHPLIFRDLKSVDKNIYPGNVIYSAVKHGIGIYSFHTNLDKANGGLNDFLCNLLGLQDISPTEKSPFLRIGRLPKAIPLVKLVKLVKEILGVSTVKYVGKDDSLIDLVSVCPGSGSSLIYNIPREVDLFITGDLKHHEAFYAREIGINVIDITHFYSETASKLLLKEKIAELCGGVRVILSETDKIPWKYYGRGGDLE